MKAARNPANKAPIFLLLTFAVSWMLVFGYFAMGGTTYSANFKVIGMTFMFVPMICAMLTQKVIYREDVCRPLGLCFRLNRWTVVGWMLPAVLTVAATGISFLITDPAADYSVRAFFMVIARGLFIWLLPNAVLAFGEEVGWRGLLQREWAPLGFWKSSWCIGLIWGLWHAPLILNGYNYPGHPVAGIFAMMVLEMLFCPLIAYVRLRSGTVLAAAIMHASFNGTTPAQALVFDRGDSLLVGVGGLPGMLVLLALNGGLYWLIRRQPPAASIPWPSTTVAAPSEETQVQLPESRSALLLAFFGEAGFVEQLD